MWMKRRFEMQFECNDFRQEMEKCWEKLEKTISFHEGIDWIDNEYPQVDCQINCDEGEEQAVYIVAEPGKPPCCACVRREDWFDFEYHFLGSVNDHFYPERGVTVNFNPDGKNHGLELNHIVKDGREPFFWILYGTVLVEFHEGTVKDVKRLVEKYLKLFAGPAYTLEYIASMV